MEILVIDDDQNIVEMVKVNLEIDGVRVVTANNGKKGIELAEKELPDLILMDWMMPGMSGIEAVKVIRKNKRLKKIPVFMLTAKSQINDADEALRAGADNYITKPFDPVDLYKVLKMKLKKIRR